jgi:ABC-2 type transport system ATP-binding protein
MVDALRPLAVDEPLVDVASRRFSMPVSGGAEVLAEALRLLDGSTAQIFDVGLRRPDLDDVFLALTGRAAEEVDTADEQPAEPVTTGGLR